MSEMSDLDILEQRLKALKDFGNDHTSDHKAADWALLRYINVPEITEAFEAIPKWYA